MSAAQQTPALKTAGRAMWMAPLLCALALGTAHADRVKLDVRSSHPLVAAGEKTTAYVKVGLTGVPLEAKARTPVNIALVLDKSGSMQGRKLQRAKEAALQAVEVLSSDDIVSVIAYDTSVQVIVPATRVSDRAFIQAGIRRISAGGNTALFAGVSKGAMEVRKFLDRNKVNRVILLSDGLANVGPSSAGELGSLGASLSKEGISVTTFGLGLGYNEDLMFALARESDGNHAFIEEAAGLARIFQAEFGDVLSVVAQDVKVEITCPEGVRPVRLLGREGDITGQKAVMSLNQLYGRREKFALLEVEVSPGAVGTERVLAEVQVSYADMGTKASGQVAGEARARYVGSAQEVAQAADRAVMVPVVQLIATERNRQAMALRDKGEVQKARQIFQQNSTFLQNNSRRYKAPSLDRLGKDNDEDARNLAPQQWNKQRKKMRKRQYEFETQQSY